jgi:NADH-quinone oxidoreductase subunit A
VSNRASDGARNPVVDAEDHYVTSCHKGWCITGVEPPSTHTHLLQSYLPVIVFTGLGLLVGGLLAAVNLFVGPRKPNVAKSDPYECGLPSDVSRTFRFGVGFYMVAMLFILFDIEVVFLYPVGVILNSANDVFVLAEILVFVVLLLVALVYVWRRGALDWN